MTRELTPRIAAEAHADSFRTSDESFKSKLIRVADRFRACRKKVIKQLKESMQLAEGAGPVAVRHCGLQSVSQPDIDIEI